MTLRFAVSLLSFSFVGVAIAQTPSSRPIEPFPAKWIHGSADCATNADPPIQIHRVDERTWILRQNKCVHAEAPFLHLLVGNEKAFLQDTGATADAAKFPLRATVDGILETWRKEHARPPLDLVVTHSHAHGDHIAGDGQFRGRPRTVVVGTKPKEVADFFGIADWPAGSATLDLGGRVLEILPIPGHEASSIAVFDPSTGFLLTGDSVYPGRLYVRDWPAFRASVARLAEFARKRPVRWVVGTHVEMSTTPGVDYPAGTTYQPDERPLQIEPARLVELDAAMREIGETPARRVVDPFIVVPLRR